MKTKEDVIKEAYELIGLPFVDNVIYDNGWLKIKPTQYSSKYDDVDLLKLTNHVHSIRPKSLQGIENNNGWIKIESEAQYDELENGEYEWYNINNGKYDKGDLWTYGVFTHYKIVPIIKINPPLF